jgi:hypothetical protein
MDELVRRFKAPYVLAAVFIIMLVTGLLLGGFGKVMVNGIVICLDCIGLI